MGKGSIPNRWLDYQALGRCISGTKIIAFKVPLKLIVCESSLPQKEWFTPSILLEKQPGLKTIIDLTNTYKYYNGQMEFGTKGIDHVKILVEGKGTIPPDSQVERFFDAMDSHMKTYADMTDVLVGVHCTHGLNRTGYFVCRWLVDRLNLDPDEAIGRFNDARGHKIERKHLLDHIKIKKLFIQPGTVYTSPLNDAAYDEPTNLNRYSRYRDKSKPSGRERDPRRVKRSNTNRDSSRRADQDANWRIRDDDWTPVFRHFKDKRHKHRDKDIRETVRSVFQLPNRRRK